MANVVVIGTRGVPGRQGGVEKHCERLYPELVAAHGFEVEICCRRGFLQPVTTPATWQGIRLKYLPTFAAGGAEAFWHSFAATIYAVGSKADLVHYHNIGPAFFLPLLRASRKRTLVTYHSRNYLHARWGPAARAVLRWGERFAVRYADHVISVTPAHVRYLESAYGARLAGKLSCIPNGVSRIDPPPELQAQVLRKFGLQKARFVMAAGRLVEEKGMRDIVQAFRKVEEPGLKLVLAGDADYASAYARSVREEAAGDSRVVMTGFLDDDALWSLYRNAALFALPSHQEGMPLALLEALASGTPVLVSDLPATRVLPLPEDRYVPPGDAAAWRDKLLRFLGVPLEEADARPIRALLAGEFNWAAVASKTAALYRRLLGEGHRSGCAQEL